jgi:hypothetical protein
LDEWSRIAVGGGERFTVAPGGQSGLRQRVSRADILQHPWVRWNLQRDSVLGY